MKLTGRLQKTNVCVNKQTAAFKYTRRISKSNILVYIFQCVILCSELWRFYESSSFMHFCLVPSSPNLAAFLWPSRWCHPAIRPFACLFVLQALSQTWYPIGVKDDVKCDQSFSFLHWILLNSFRVSFIHLRTLLLETCSTYEILIALWFWVLSARGSSVVRSRPNWNGRKMLLVSFGAVFVCICWYFSHVLGPHH